MKYWQLRFLIGTSAGRMNPVLLAALLCAWGAAAQDGYWVNPRGASWAGAGNWDKADGIAGGADSTAYFGFAREASLGPSESFTFDGPQTIGNLCFTTQGGPANWSFNPGPSGSLTLAATFGLPAITVTASSLEIDLNAVVGGTAGLQKDGPGVLVLGASNTYAGRTLVRGGVLNITGSVGAGGVEVTNATLGGTGIILGPVVVDAGGSLSLGNPSGPLTISNSLVLRPGSTTWLSVNAAASGQAAVQGLSRVTYGGTLVVTNRSGAFSLGQSFSIFGSAPGTGNFSRILPPPGPWLRWRFNPGTGQISVVSSESQPAFSSVDSTAGGVVYRVTNGPPGSTGYTLASADLSQPMSAWTPIATNVFDLSGTFATTNALSAGGPGKLFWTVFVIPSP